MNSFDLISSLIPDERRLEESLSGPGIYYILPSPVPLSDRIRWEITAYSFEEYGAEIDHIEVWGDHLSAMLSTSWKRRLKRKTDDIDEDLFDLVYAFPRGRITTKLEHLNGDNTDPVGWSAGRIERYFGLDGKCVRQFDPHETCSKEQRDKACKVLGIEPTWPVGQP